MAQLPANRRNQGGPLSTHREHPLERLQRDFDTLFGRLWGGWLAPSPRDVESLRVWDFDVTENDREMVVRAEMPGFEENEIEVQLDNDVLTIKAEKEQKGDGQQEYRSFFRSIALPAGIEADKAQATYRNGVLELHIPRREASQARRIRIQGKQAGSTQPETGNTAPAAGQQQQAGQRAEQAVPEKTRK